MSTAVAASPAQPTPLRPFRGLAYGLVGWILASLVLHVFRVWAGMAEWNGGSLDTALGLGALSAKSYASAVGGILGFLAGLTRPGLVFRERGFFRALFGAAVGYPLGVLLVGIVRVIFGLDFYEADVMIVFGTVTSLVVYFWGIGAWTHWWPYMIGSPTPEHEDHADHGAQSWKDYFKFNTDHKVIGVQYLVTVFFFMAIGGAFAETIRAELANPGLQYLSDGQVFNQIVSAHGIIMLLMFIIPVFAGLANFVLPLMIGAPDMAFPRLNALSYWMLLFGGCVFLASFPMGAFAAGWTNYAPLSTTGGPAGLPLGQLMFVLGVQIAGSSSIVTAINFLVTIIGMRAPGMSMWRMPLLVWANFTTSLLVVFGTPFIAGAQFMVLFDTVMNTAFFKSNLGGDAIQYQHIFWFYSHPAVYIMILPGFGIISEVITSHARKPIFGYRALAASTLAIGLLGFSVWAHHMFTSGMADVLRPIMMFATMLIAVPTGIKVLGWSATLWKARIHLRVPMLWAIGFLFTFTCGGLTGIMVASVPFDLHVQDTYFVVAHFHYVLFGGSLMTVMAGMYHWFPKMTGRMYDERLGRLHFWLTFIGLNVTFFPMHWVGTLGMPRRVADYELLAKIHESVGPTNFVISVGAFLQGIAFMVFFYNMVTSWRSGPKAAGNPWRALTLEWLVSSPPPLFNFSETPHVVGGPYDYGIPGARHAVLTAAELEHVKKPATVSSAH